MDYTNACGLFDDLDSAKRFISNIERKLNEQTLHSDVAALSSLDTNYLSNLSDNLDTTETSLENSIKSLKNIEESVKAGRKWY